MAADSVTRQLDLEVWIVKDLEVGLEGNRSLFCYDRLLRSGIKA